MAYALLTTLGKAGRSLSAAAAMLRGVNSVYPLTDVERRHLRLLISSRLACSVTLGAYSYQQNPENEYLLLHAQPAWNALGLLWGQGKSGAMAKAIDNLFDVACSGGAAGGKCIDCSDISMPDPSIPDLLASVRRTDASTDDAYQYASSPQSKKPRLDPNVPPAITFVTGNKKARGGEAHPIFTRRATLFSYKPQA